MELINKKRLIDTILNTPSNPTSNVLRNKALFRTGSEFRQCEIIKIINNRPSIEMGDIMAFVLYKFMDYAMQATAEHQESKPTATWREHMFTFAEIEQIIRRALEAPEIRAEPEKETAKRVLWTGWKGIRDTRYKCPNCKKPVKNDDVYCHRCGQKLMFPHISFTDYIQGEKQKLIVRWDNE